MDKASELGAFAVKEIPLSEISLSQLNVRNDLQSGTEDSSLDDLARSIGEKGLLNPLTVRYKNGRYDLIVGKRRFLACQSLGWKNIPAIVRTDLQDADARILSARARTLLEAMESETTPSLFLYHTMLRIDIRSCL